jgi:N-acetylglucosaminyldiphosphoundecaprenol N-acetyl-beta-D-mannosaminyltransferase
MKIKNLIFKIENISSDKALEYISEKAKKEEGKTFVATINTELIMLARNDTEYEKVLSSTDLAVCDGVGVMWAAKIFGRPLKSRIHGVDLVDNLSRIVAKGPLTVGFLGAGKNVAQMAADCLKQKYPGLEVAFAAPEWDQIKGKKDCDILFVAFGSPKQEKWIYENLPKINVHVAIGVGGAFDFISGRVRRAPKWMRKIGLEWLFRLIIQPWRIKRQLVLPEFVLLVLKERFL